MTISQDTKNKTLPSLSEEHLWKNRSGGGCQIDSPPAFLGLRVCSV